MNTNIIRTKHGMIKYHTPVFVISLVCATLCTYGCRPTSEATEQDQTASRSSVELLADGITGRYAIEAGKRAKSDIEAIAEEQNARLEELIGD